MNLGTAAVRGAGSVMGGQVLRMLLQIGSVAVLTRLLDPKDYGLFTAGMLLVGFGEVFRDFGLSTAAIQAKTLSNAQRDTLFWLNTALGAGFGVAMLGAAPLVAWWFGHPELFGITAWLGVVFLLNGAASQYRAGLNRSLRFNALVVSDLVSSFVGIIAAIAMVLTGWGYWALVGQQIVGGVVLIAMMVGYSRWLPGPPKRGAGVRPMVRFGMGMVATQVVGYFASNVDNMIIGSRLGMSELGIYSRGYQLLIRTVNQFRAPTTTVALPVLSRLEGRDRNDAFMTTGQLALGYSLVPLITVGAATAQPIVAIVLGAKFQAVGPIFAVLAIASIFQTVSYAGYWVYLARGLTKHLFGYSLIALAVKVACVAAGSFWGVFGVAVGFAVSEAVSWPVTIWWLSRFTPIPVKQLWIGAGRIIAAAGFAGGIGFWVVTMLSGQPAILALLAGALAVAAGYTALAVIPAFLRDYKTMFGLVARALPKKAG